MKTSFKFIEVFAGVGGFRLGLESLGGECVWACELDTQARLTYKANFGRTPYYDIRKADLSSLPHFDVLTAGFPCQDFSTLGEQNGLSGDKGSLFFEVIRVMKQCQPPIVFLENVKGLTTMKDGEVMKHVVQSLEALGYFVHYKVINSSWLLPQFRNRVYIIAFKDGKVSSRFRFFDEPELVPPRVVNDILHDDIEEPFLEHWKLSVQQWKSVKRSKVSLKYGIKKRLCLPGDNFSDTLVASYRNSVKSIAQFVAPLDYVEGKVGERPRWFTPRECARLMGFPEGFVLHPKEVTACSQLGNAVCPPIIAFVGGAILAALEDSEIRKNNRREFALETSLKLALSATGEMKKEAFCLKEVHTEEDKGQSRVRSVAKIIKPSPEPPCDKISTRTGTVCILCLFAAISVIRISATN